MTDNVDISSLIIPIQNNALLLPNVAMAELVTLEEDISYDSANR